ncbi:MAG: outer membrane lipoprotein-sorting protein, partial [bacterium]|nr:outer membrane lipoprotein-sorting protein [bacterium]
MKRLIISAVIALLAITNLSFAQQELTGLEIITNVYNREDGNDQKGDLTMTLVNKFGDQRVRKIQQFIRDFGNVEKKIMFFLEPADVRNTSFMNWSYTEAGKDDDQWIYLPALKKVKRISSDSKSDYFMGSDFTYDDLGDRHPDEDTHKLLRTEKIGDEECYVVESIPKEEDYMYSRTLTWVIKDKWIGLKKEFYDEDGDLLKILTINKYEKINDYWTILDTEMKNVQRDHKTLMQLANIKYDTNISEQQFTERMMKR